MHTQLPVSARVLPPSARGHAFVDPRSLSVPPGPRGRNAIADDGGHHIDLDDAHVVDLVGRPRLELPVEVLRERGRRRRVEHLPVVQEQHAVGREVGQQRPAGFPERAPGLVLEIGDGGPDALAYRRHGGFDSPEDLD
jgi:hypothetical protein